MKRRLLAHALCALALSVSSRAAEHVRITYEVKYDPAPEAMRWEIRVSVTGLDPSKRDISLRLSNWGGWPEIDTLYLRGVRGTPPIRSTPDTPTEFRVDPPDDWDGRIEVSYCLSMSRCESNAFKRYGLIPCFAGTYSRGFSTNTLMLVCRGGDALDTPCDISLEAPPGISIATGWSGVSLERQLVHLEHAVDNSLILFGSAVGVAALEREGVTCEVIQFGGERDVTNELAPVFQSLITGYGELTGRPINQPARLFVTDMVGGGTRVDHGFTVGVSHEGTEIGGPDFRNLLAHEVFHEWLGGRLRETDAEAIVWFKEGFTDYLSLWQLAHLKLIEPDWFAARLVALDTMARGSPAFGATAFANDVNWRDDNGPNETLAYKGGALLAFFADAALRRSGRPGLPQMIRDLLNRSDGAYSQATIREWMEKNGLGEFYAAYVKRPGLPELRETLLSIGYQSTKVPVTLAYLGLATEDNQTFGRVTAVDPSGPAASAGVRVGDRITGFYPSREPPVHVNEDVDDKYPYGLEKFAPDIPGAYIGVRRGELEVRCEISPSSIPGGYVDGYRWDSAAPGDFFNFVPAK